MEILGEIGVTFLLGHPVYYKEIALASEATAPPDLPSGSRNGATTSNDPEVLPFQKLNCSLYLMSLILCVGIKLNKLGGPCYNGPCA